MRRGGAIGATAAALLALQGCVHAPPPSAAPRVVANPEIVLPPPPQRPLTVGVYSCIDTTGQRRPTIVPQELSTAVPMDCTPYLIDAVRKLRPGYVYLVERQHVDELLRERQLATLALNSATAADAAQGPPQPNRRLNTLRVAEVLLIGQVVAYDRSTSQTAGGVAVGGKGVNGTYVTDMITFSLRAVAVQTGEVLGVTTVTKSVTSVRIAGRFTEILTTNVLDLEAGTSVNEPVGIALGASVRSALTQLIQQGIKDGWWS